jgi:hypothetical protein
LEDQAEISPALTRDRVAATPGVGTNRTTSDVRSSVAIGGIADVARTRQFGRD